MSILLDKQMDDYILTCEYQAISEDFRKLGMFSDLESYINKFVSKHYYESISNDKIVDSIIENIKQNIPSYLKMNSIQQNEIKEYIYRIVNKSISTLNKQYPNFNTFTNSIKSDASKTKKKAALQLIDKDMILDTVALVNYAVNLYLGGIEKKALVGVFKKKVIKEYIIKKMHLPHLLGFEFGNHTKLDGPSRKTYLKEIGINENYFNSLSSYQKMMKLIDKLSNEDYFINSELNRANSGRETILNYAKINAKTRSFICNSCFENIDRIIVLKNGTAPKGLKIGLTDQISLLNSRLEGPNKYNLSSLIYYQSLIDNPYPKSNMIFSEAEADFKKLEKSAVMETEKILIIDRNGNTHYIGNISTTTSKNLDSIFESVTNIIKEIDNAYTIDIDSGRGVDVDYMNFLTSRLLYYINEASDQKGNYLAELSYLDEATLELGLSESTRIEDVNGNNMPKKEIIKKYPFASKFSNTLELNERII